MRILALETSCDETAAAIVEDGTKIVASVVASSQEIQKKYGGIVPEQAAREQTRSLIPVINATFEKAKTSIKNKSAKNETYQTEIEAIAITVGPGLIGSLLVGIETAKTLAWLWKKPLIPVNHLIAHIYANFLNKQNSSFAHKHIFPALCLTVSGGHTDLFLMKNHGQYRWLGGTRDDAAGECFDKCARLLGLSYPGGPAVAAAAAKFKKAKSRPANLPKFQLPKPMLNQNNFDFSFSGLKTALLNFTKKLKPLNSLVVSQLAYELQEAVTDVLVSKTLKAAAQFAVKSILVGGGVAANKRLREKFKSTTNQPAYKSLKLFLPPFSLCTDNAAVVASAAYFNYHPLPWQKIKAQPNLEIK